MIVGAKLEIRWSHTLPKDGGAIVKIQMLF
jgi:hypothetical protein